MESHKKSSMQSAKNSTETPTIRVFRTTSTLRHPISPFSDPHQTETRNQRSIVIDQRSLLSFHNHYTLRTLFVSFTYPRNTPPRSSSSSFVISPANSPHSLIQFVVFFLKISAWPTVSGQRQLSGIVFRHFEFHG